MRLKGLNGPQRHMSQEKFVTPSCKTPKTMRMPFRNVLFFVHLKKLLCSQWCREW